MSTTSLDSFVLATGLAFADALGNMNRKNSHVLARLLKNRRKTPVSLAIVLSNLDALQEISPPVDLPISVPWFALASGLAAMAVISAALYRSWPLPTRESTAPLPAPAAALQALDDLLRESLAEQGKVKELYQSLTGILRRYLQEQFGIGALELTTVEFITALHHHRGIYENHKTLLEACLKHCDLVKFAEHQPTPDDIRNIFECFRHLIHEMSYAP